MEIPKLDDMIQLQINTVFIFGCGAFIGVFAVHATNPWLMWIFITLLVLFAADLIRIIPQTIRDYYE